MTARLATAQVPLHIDVNFGDPIWPAPTEAVLPLLLGGTLRLLGYPDHMVLAEKTVTALERGEQNTRWRDFTDIAAIARSRTVDGADLQEAIGVVARYRQVELEPLGPLLAQMPALAGNGNVYGSYVHGIFDAPGIADEILKAICARRGVAFSALGTFDRAAYR